MVERCNAKLVDEQEANAFIGILEVQDNGRDIQIKLSGHETLTECDREQCAVQDCCGDTAFAITAQVASVKRSFLARSDGIGAYVALDGRGLRFSTHFVPGDDEREQTLRQRFGMLPRAALCDSVLCIGEMTLRWPGLPALVADPGSEGEARATTAPTT